MPRFTTKRVHEWFQLAEVMTIKDLPVFVESITKSLRKDVDYRCIPEFPQLIAAIALAGANAATKIFTKLLTPEQKQAVLVHFIKEWNPEYKKAPFRLIDYSWMLYPQYKDMYTGVHPEVFKWLQSQAATLLEMTEKEREKGGQVPQPETIKHWESITSGIVPFGLELKITE